LLDPAFHAMAAMESCSPFDDLTDPGEVFHELKLIAEAVTTGDMKHPEALAVAQATALHTMFSRLSRQAFSNASSPFFDTLMRLALRAQSQSARTLQTLATLKSPSIYAHQLNVANQQVIANGTPLASPTSTIANHANHGPDSQTPLQKT
jgi:hypothetical protein